MSKKLYEESDVQAIANAIRTKNGLTDTYTISQMAAAISAIETGGGGLERAHRRTAGRQADMGHPPDVSADVFR